VAKLLGPLEYYKRRRMLESMEAGMQTVSGISERSYERGPARGASEKQRSVFPHTSNAQRLIGRSYALYAAQLARHSRWTICLIRCTGAFMEPLVREELGGQVFPGAYLVGDASFYDQFEAYIRAR